jgi:hydrogenase nickel incorporation protein HypA/HybF
VHEWALAEGVIDTAVELAEKEGFKRITKIVVRIGALQRIDPDFFRKAIETVMPDGDPRLQSAELVLNLEPAGFLCRGCGHEFARDDTGTGLDSEQLEAIHFVPELAHAFLQCPECESPDFEVRHGRGLWLDSLEGEQ